MRIVTILAIGLMIAAAGPSNAKDWHIAPLPTSMLGGGCFSAYAITDHSGNDIFIEWPDEPPTAKMMIDGKLFDLTSTGWRVSGDDGGWDPTGTTFDDTFTDATGKLVVTRHTTITQYSEASDGNIQEGTLQVTFKGLSRSFKIQGGMAC